MTIEYGWHAYSTGPLGRFVAGNVFYLVRYYKSRKKKRPGGINMELIEVHKKGKAELKALDIGWLPDGVET